MKPHYSEEEAHAILRRAIEKMPLPRSMSLEQLERIGAEIGITPEALCQAEAEHVSVSAGQRRKYATFVANETATFRNHLYSFIGVNTVLFLIVHFTSQDLWWFLWPLLVWGLVLTCHAFKLFDRDSQHHVNSFFQYLRATQNRAAPPADRDCLPPTS